MCSKVKELSKKQGNMSSSGTIKEMIQSSRTSLSVFLRPMLALSPTARCEIIEQSASSDFNIKIYAVDQIYLLGVVAIFQR